MDLSMCTKKLRTFKGTKGFIVTLLLSSFSTFSWCEPATDNVNNNEVKVIDKQSISSSVNHNKDQESVSVTDKQVINTSSEANNSAVQNEPQKDLSSNPALKNGEGLSGSDQGSSETDGSVDISQKKEISQESAGNTVKQNTVKSDGSDDSVTSISDKLKSSSEENNSGNVSDTKSDDSKQHSAQISEENPKSVKDPVNPNDKVSDELPAQGELSSSLQVSPDDAEKEPASPSIVNDPSITDQPQKVQVTDQKVATTSELPESPSSIPVSPVDTRKESAASTIVNDPSKTNQPQNVHVTEQKTVTTSELPEFSSLSVSAADTNKDPASSSDGQVLISSGEYTQLIFLGYAVLIINILLFLILIKQMIKSRSIAERAVKNYQGYTEKQQELTQEALVGLGQDLEKILELAKQTEASAESHTEVSKSGDTLKNQHDIVKIVADRLAFIKVTMTRMDPKVKGYKQLSKSISQIIDNLHASGYEIIDYLGQEYNDGMKVVATFITDEDLQDGQRIVTGVVKPQINYQGVMIQPAQLTVSQN